ncbi:probable multidrug resistance-associated protein lethal(2)03659 [Cryptotermes secundus]|uniref:probable multidrug resistance-associated protein lethal(2)03659 n=1 Tax=Cryptotermes secundus TaxID=105785 RepID=UPI000CD7D9A7|nr:probable multidrug resistance-associated protein lethal(2)03659 [Cryptotermes secundus]
MEDLPKNTLTELNLDVRPRELMAVVGPVSSGKTSLLKELPLNSGSISVDGSVSYASQEPWLFTGSVQQNILFGHPMDRNQYRQVVRVCALERDFQLLPHGDRTIVGERGVTLSGGQRARFSLAR